MASTPVLPKLVGARIKRREDPRLIQGRATYVDDVKIAGMQHIAFKRSDIAHGRIVWSMSSAAAAMEGVEAVFTGAHIAAMLEPLPIATPFPSPPHRAVAVDVVRYAGEPVAVVVARNRYIARDAVDAIQVEYEPLPVVVDPELAMTGQPTVIHEAFPNNLAVPLVPSGTGVSADGKTVDDSAIDKAFAQADVVISQRMMNHRLVPNAIESRGVVAHFEPGKAMLTVWSSTQNPHILRTLIAAMTGLGQNQVRAIAPEVGGGFGSRSTSTPKSTSQRSLSKHLELPVKWIEDRSEGLRGYDSRTRHHRVRRRSRAARWKSARTEDAADRRYRRLQHAAHGRHPDAHDDDGERVVRHSGDSDNPDRGIHQQDPDRRLPRRRTSGSHIFRRTGNGHARARTEDGPGGGTSKKLHFSRRSSRSPRRWVPSTTPATMKRHSTALLKRPIGMDSRHSATPGVAKGVSWASGCRCMSRCAASVLRRRCRPAGGSMHR